MIGKLNYPDICQKPYSAESRALINSSVALMRICFPRRSTLSHRTLESLIILIKKEELAGDAQLIEDM